MENEDYASDFLIPPPERLWDILGNMVRRCPVAHSEQDGGFWVVTGYEDVFNVLQDWKTFSSTGAKMIPDFPDESRPPPLPPVDFDPPLQRQYRELIGPYLSPQAVAQHEAGTREIVADAIEAFVQDGRCDVAAQLGPKIVPAVFFRLIFDLHDDEELENIRQWAHKIVYDYTDPDSEQAGRNWFEWTAKLRARLLSEPRKDNILDAILYGTVEDGRPVTDAEFVGFVMDLVFGGFHSTIDAISNSVIKLAEYPDIQTRVREDPSLIPSFIEEVLRHIAPTSALARMCTRDTELHGQSIKAGERVMWSAAAANRDPKRFEQPDEFDIFREQSPHFTFGGGVHRCPGSTLARMETRVTLEELLARVTDIRFTDGEQVHRRAVHNIWWIPTYVPISFTPIPAQVGSRSG